MILISVILVVIAEVGLKENVENYVVTMKLEELFLKFHRKGLWVNFYEF